MIPLAPSVKFYCRIFFMPFSLKVGCRNLDPRQSGVDSFIVALKPLLSIPTEVALETSNPRLFTLKWWGCTRFLSLGEFVANFLDTNSSQQGTLQEDVVFWCSAFGRSRGGGQVISSWNSAYHSLKVTGNLVSLLTNKIR